MCPSVGMYNGPLKQRVYNVPRVSGACSALAYSANIMTPKRNYMNKQIAFNSCTEWGDDAGDDFYDYDPYSVEEPSGGAADEPSATVISAVPIQEHGIECDDISSRFPHYAWEHQCDDVDLNYLAITYDQQVLRQSYSDASWQARQVCCPIRYLGASDYVAQECEMVQERNRAYG